jgi:hypothetical protein
MWRVVKIGAEAGLGAGLSVVFLKMSLALPLRTSATLKNADFGPVWTTPHPSRGRRSPI